MKLKGPMFDSFVKPPKGTGTTSVLSHPHRALPPGKQYNAHCGTKARERTLRQQARTEQKRLRTQYGSTSVVGKDPDSGGLILDIPMPTRIMGAHGQE